MCNKCCEDFTEYPFDKSDIELKYVPDSTVLNFKG